MVCRKCGKEIPEGSLYCEMCGADVRIVPVFEAEVEHTIERTLSEVFEQAFPQEDVPPNEEETDENELPKTHNHLVLGIVLGFAICLLAIVLTVYFYLSNSLEHQLVKATEYINAGKYGAAIPYLEKVVELDSENIDYRLLLADAYQAQARTDEYLATLAALIPYMEEVPTLRTVVCDRYVSYYVGIGDYRQLHNALLTVVTDAVYAAYDPYIIEPVTFSHSGGYYKEIVPLKLSSRDKGKIYYTLDGSEPTSSSEVYKAPIFLKDGGNYTVKAMFVSDTGVCSEVTTQEYSIEEQPPAPPVVRPTSGEFAERQMIYVDKEEYEDVYYTTNGTNPTTSSERYIGPIEMPEGYTLFRCIKVTEDGRISDVTEREYLLFINESTKELTESQ